MHLLHDRFKCVLFVHFSSYENDIKNKLLKVQNPSTNPNVTQVLYLNSKISHLLEVLIQYTMMVDLHRIYHDYQYFRLKSFKGAFR